MKKMKFLMKKIQMKKIKILMKKIQMKKIMKIKNFNVVEF